VFYRLHQLSSSTVFVNRCRHPSLQGQSINTGRSSTFGDMSSRLVLAFEYFAGLSFSL